MVPKITRKIKRTPNNSKANPSLRLAGHQARTQNDPKHKEDVWSCFWYLFLQFRIPIGAPKPPKCQNEHSNGFPMFPKPPPRYPKTDYSQKLAAHMFLTCIQNWPQIVPTGPKYTHVTSRNTPQNIPRAIFDQHAFTWFKKNEHIKGIRQTTSIHESRFRNCTCVFLGGVNGRGAVATTKL